MRLATTSLFFSSVGPALFSPVLPGSAKTRLRFISVLQNMSVERDNKQCCGNSNNNGLFVQPVETTRTIVGALWSSFDPFFLG